MCPPVLGQWWDFLFNICYRYEHVFPICPLTDRWCSVPHIRQRRQGIPCRATCRCFHARVTAAYRSHQIGHWPHGQCMSRSLLNSETKWVSCAERSRVRFPCVLLAVVSGFLQHPLQEESLGDFWQADLAHTAASALRGSSHFPQYPNFVLYREGKHSILLSPPSLG